MADEEISEQIEEKPAMSGKRKNIILAGIVLGIMLAEGVAVFVLAKHFSATPSSAEASGLGGLNPEAPAEPQEVEVEVVRFRAQSDKSQRVMVYDLSVFAIVDAENVEKFAELVGRKQATIQDRLASIVRAAEPKRFTEPNLATLRQQFKRELAAIIGDEGMIKKVLIPSMVSYADN